MRGLVHPRKFGSEETVWNRDDGDLCYKCMPGIVTAMRISGQTNLDRVPISWI